MRTRQSPSIPFIAAGALLALFLSTPPVSAQKPTPTFTPPKTDAACLMCHGVKNFTAHFQNGTRRSLYVDADAYARSIHGAEPLRCNECHGEKYSRYPHRTEDNVTCTTCHTDLTGGKDKLKPNRQPDLNDIATLPYPDERTYILKLNETCARCHTEEIDANRNGVHAQALKAGNPNAPTCTDCHTAHATTKADTPRTRIPQTCSQCHQAVYSSYATSVHGAALINEQNIDVPTCTTCHGVHKISDPTRANFRNSTPQLCARCHADRELMAKYDLSTDVLRTYLDDFHGRTVNFIARVKPNMPTDKATCTDCHGVHDIRGTQDANASVVRANLQVTCARCHADAGVNFPDAWAGHDRPTWDKQPGVFTVNVVYTILIPVTVGFFVLYIGLDAHRRFSGKHALLRIRADVGDESSQPADGEG